MPDIAIRVEGLGKRYRIGARQEKYKTFGDSVSSALTRPFRAIRGLSHQNGHLKGADSIWALKDISFEIKRGEVVGVIGRNGAGKSTLLKILSRITDPTEGMADIFGPLGSLLEVGTGFHPELTGRENTYLNGAILGMGRNEIDNKFDEIVAFAEIETFIDTPVKHYSSGMYLRLAFAVAAHLGSEILLVDEVLAVGDAAFQERCLGKMKDVSSEGRTVLFVSHNMAAVQSLCRTAMLLDEGKVSATGSPLSVINNYLNSSSCDTTKLAKINLKESKIEVQDIAVEQNGFKRNAFWDPCDELGISVEYELKSPINNLLLGFDVYSSSGLHLFRSYDLDGYGMGERVPGKYISIFKLPPNVFQRGTYFFDFLLGIHRQGWISKSDFRMKLVFGGAAVSDVDYPGALQSLGSWHVTQGH